MKLSIDKYPHAFFDIISNTAYLAHYYPYDAVKDQSLSIVLWREGSYSPQILDYKEGKEAHIFFFVDPFTEMIKQILKYLNQSSATLIPVPSSTAPNDPAFSKVPYDKTKSSKRKNMDDRNLIFCRKLSEHNQSISVREIVYRKETIPQKSRSLELHLKSLELCLETIRKGDFPNDLFLLIDDVATSYSTMDAVEQIMKKEFNKAKFFRLTLGLAREPQNFLHFSENEQNLQESTESSSTA